MAVPSERPAEVLAGAAPAVVPALGERALLDAVDEPVAVIVGGDLEVGDDIDDYMRRLWGREELLDAAEEVELARQIEAGLVAEKVLQLIGKTTRPKAEREILVGLNPQVLEDLQKMADRPELKSWQGRRHLRTVRNEGRAAMHRFLQANLRLVVSIAKRYVGKTDLTFNDLIQEGNLGLIRGVEKFDFTRGYKFSTYGTNWIRQNILRAMAAKGSLIRKPDHIVGAIRGLNRVRRDLRTELCDEPLPEEIAAAMGVSPDRVVELLEWEAGVRSLDYEVGHQRETPFVDILDRGDPRPEQIVLAQLDVDHLYDLLSRLAAEDGRMTAVIRLRFGLEDGIAYSPTKVASRLKMSRDLVKQLEGRALRRLQELAQATAFAA